MNDPAAGVQFERLTVIMPSPLVDRLEKVLNRRWAKMPPEEAEATSALCYANGWPHSQFVTGVVLASFLIPALDEAELEAPDD